LILVPKSKLNTARHWLDQHLPDIYNIIPGEHPTPVRSDKPRFSNTMLSYADSLRQKYAPIVNPSAAGNESLDRPPCQVSNPTPPARFRSWVQTQPVSFVYDEDFPQHLPASTHRKTFSNVNNSGYGNTQTTQSTSVSSLPSPPSTYNQVDVQTLETTILAKVESKINLQVENALKNHLAPLQAQLQNLQNAISTLISTTTQPQTTSTTSPPLPGTQLAHALGAHEHTSLSSSRSDSPISMSDVNASRLMHLSFEDSVSHLPSKTGQSSGTAQS